MDNNLIKCGLAFLAGTVCGFVFHKYKDSPKSGEDKNRKYSQLFDNWLILSERGEGIGTYFKERDMKEVAVYGYGNIGRHVITQLSYADIQVKYIIDQRKDGILSGDMVCYGMGDSLPDVDAVIVTPICEYGEIEERLQKRISAPIVSIEDIIYELL